MWTSGGYNIQQIPNLTSAVPSVCFLSLFACGFGFRGVRRQQESQFNKNQTQQKSKFPRMVNYVDFRSI